MLLDLGSHILYVRITQRKNPAKAGDSHSAKFQV